MPYQAPLDDIQFTLDHLVGYARVYGTDRFADAGADTVQAVLAEAGRMAAEVLGPLNRAGDTNHARLENGVVRTSPGFADGYRAIADGGWIGMAANPDHGGMGLPITLQTAVFEMIASGCLSLQLCPLLSLGQIEAIEAHASDDIKALYLPRLISGEWVGTMNLTESQAGSDVGALTTKAEPMGDGTYRVTGQKIFISWGDNDFSGNVCHMVLARLPDAPPGTKGISLFLVPKYLPDAGGDPSVANSLRVVSLEEKMGLHGSPTCVMAYEGATGWLVGDEGGGMAAMFTMMNNARLGTGMQGTATAEAAFQHALAYANARKQGRTPVDGRGTIVDHADVRRMLMTMKAETFAARAIGLECAVAIDMGKAAGDPAWRSRAAFLTPIAKAYCSDTGVLVADLGVQVHGGMGYIEETGAAQFLRDVRVVTIYEGTNGIQAMDLVGRKLADGGAEAHAILAEVSATAKSATAMPDEARALADAAERLGDLTERFVAMADLNERFAGATAYLKAFARVLGAHYHLKAALAEGSDGPRTALARFFVARILPQHLGLVVEAGAGAAVVYGVDPDALAV